MYSLRRRYRARKTRKALSSYRRRKAFGVRTRSRRLRRRSGLSRFRKGRSSSRRRPVIRRFRRRRPIGRGRRLLSSRADTARSYKYNDRGRRPKKMNRSLARKVAEAQGHEIHRSDLVNLYGGAVTGVCDWHFHNVGSPAQMKALFSVAESSAQGYLVPDANTLYGSPSQVKMKMRIMKMERVSTFVNESTNPIWVEIYELTPRADIYGTGNDPYNLMSTYSRDGDLPASGAGTDIMPYNDPRFTPFMVPYLTQLYKIGKVRKFKVHAGAKWVVVAACNNVLVSPSRDWDNSQLYAKRGKFKCIFMKTYGDLGVATDGAGVKFVRHLPHTWVAKAETTEVGHLSADERVIFQDKNGSRNGGSFTSAQFVDEDLNVVMPASGVIATTNN